ncbi:hypothetical protein Tco_0300109 [Tanacetum coccineum]
MPLGAGVTQSDCLDRLSEIPWVVSTLIVIEGEVKENSFIPASLDYDHEMVQKSKDWVERLNPNRKLPNFNTRRILVPESQAVNECLQLTKASADPESSKELGSEP